MELLQDICLVSFNPDELKEGENSPENYHNTLQWLKVGNKTAMCLESSALNNFQAFPEPLQDVIEVWEKYLILASRHHKYLWQDDPQYDLETRWRKWHANLEEWFPHLRGQNSEN
jgi:hypothetical protein